MISNTGFKTLASVYVLRIRYGISSHWYVTCFSLKNFLSINHKKSFIFNLPLDVMSIFSSFNKVFPTFIFFNKLSKGKFFIESNALSLATITRNLLILITSGISRILNTSRHSLLTKHFYICCFNTQN